MPAEGDVIVPKEHIEEDRAAARNTGVPVFRFERVVHIGNTRCGWSRAP